MPETTWTVPADFLDVSCPGDSIWIEQDDKFTKVRFRGFEFDAGSSDATLLGARRCPDCGGATPPTFTFCPNCGARTATVQSPSICHWPSFGANGWAETTKLRSAKLEDRSEVAITGGDWGFAVAGDPASLIGYDHENGMIARYDGKGWTAVTRAAPSPLRPWQRAIIASRWGVHIPHENQGVGFLPTPFIAGTKLATSAVKLGAARPVGGPTVWFDSVYLPVLADEALRLDACRLGKSPSRDPSVWHSQAIDDFAGIKASQFGAPFTNEAADVFWASEHCYIVLTNNGEGPVARLLPWRTGFTALPAARPYRSRRGGVAWQLGRYQANEGAEPEFAFHLASPSASRQELKTVSGPHLSYGPGTFRGDKRHDDPWIDTAVDYDPGSDNKVFVPLCCFGEGEHAQYVVVIVDGREKLWDLLSEHGTAAPVDARFHLLGRRQGNIVQLNAVFAIQSIHDLSSVLFGDQLFVYSRCENRIISWRIVT